MKITVNQLRRIIKEEVEKTLYKSGDFIDKSNVDSFLEQLRPRLEELINLSPDAKLEEVDGKIVMTMTVTKGSSNSAPCDLEKLKGMSSYKITLETGLDSP